MPWTGSVAIQRGKPCLDGIPGDEDSLQRWPPRCFELNDSDPFYQASKTEPSSPVALPAENSELIRQSREWSQIRQRLQKARTLRQLQQEEAAFQHRLLYDMQCKLECAKTKLQPQEKPSRFRRSLSSHETRRQAKRAGARHAMELPTYSLPSSASTSPKEQQQFTDSEELSSPLRRSRPHSAAALPRGEPSGDQTQHMKPPSDGSPLARMAGEHPLVAKAREDAKRKNPAAGGSSSAQPRRWSISRQLSNLSLASGLERAIEVIKERPSSAQSAPVAGQAKKPLFDCVVREHLEGYKRANVVTNTRRPGGRRPTPLF
eukprot:TRINITY_DN38223_c0_g1_i1.p1 TRINITY_DN38223_c0_g1~~TRINITY_DN38223_c0_g1_i1.p1  ORF type:complete len:334 (+),score=45.96 TRINITY_DN38223_c0_g1_i1:49-1002(+)